jgi:hypothetical protein
VIQREVTPTAGKGTGALGGAGASARGTLTATDWQLRLSTLRAHGGLPPERYPGTPPITGRPPSRPPSAPTWERPSSRRASLEPIKITVKSGAFGAVTRDGLRPLLTVIFLGT